MTQLNSQVDLRYPIGKYEHKESLTPTERDIAITQIAATPHHRATSAKGKEPTATARRISVSVGSQTRRPPLLSLLTTEPTARRAHGFA